MVKDNECDHLVAKRQHVSREVVWCSHCGAIGQPGEPGRFDWNRPAARLYDELLRRAVGVISDLQSLESQIAIVLDGYACIHPLDSAVARTRARLAVVAEQRHPLNCLCTPCVTRRGSSGRL